MILNIANTNINVVTTTADGIEWNFKYPVSIDSLKFDLSEYVSEIIANNYSVKCYYRIGDEFVGGYSKNKKKPFRFDDVEDVIVTNDNEDFLVDITNAIKNSGGFVELFPKNNIPVSCKVIGIQIVIPIPIGNNIFIQSETPTVTDGDYWFDISLAI